MRRVSRAGNYFYYETDWEAVKKMEECYEKKNGSVFEGEWECSHSDEKDELCRECTFAPIALKEKVIKERVKKRVEEEIKKGMI